MKLKDILKEQDKEKWVHKLEKKLETGKWRVEEPRIYRGRSSEDKNPVMEKYTTSGREPQDTNQWVDMLVNKFHEVCYPKFPARNKSRFGTTTYGYAYGFADKGVSKFGSVYVILPAKSATIYYRPSDPIEVFNTMSRNLTSLPSDLERWFRESDQSTMDLWKSVPDDFMYLADSIKEFVDNKYIEGQFIQELGCPSRLMDIVQRDIHSIEEKPPRWARDLRSVIESLNIYFSELDPGWPDEENDEDEVTFHGDYLQVENSIYNEWKDSSS